MTAVAARPSSGLAARVRLRDGIRLEVSGTDHALVGEGRTTTLRRLSPAAAELVAALAAPAGLAHDHLAEVDTAGTFGRLLDRLGHLTVTTVGALGADVMHHEPTVRDGRYRPADLTDTDLVRLDRFALLRTRGDRLVLECPRSVHRFVLVDATARRLAADLAEPVRVGDLPEVGADVDADVDTGSTGPDGSVSARDILSHWVGAGLVERADADGRFATDTDPVLRLWDYHDLLMHSRTRSGRFDEPLGALSPYRGVVDPPPAVVPPRPDALAVVELTRTAGTAQALGLLDAMERRRSIRDYADDPLTLPELGELLHRSFRTRARFDPTDPTVESKISRPYPSGGGLYEHELYLTVRRCTGLPPGVYRYDGLAHTLELVNDSPDAAREMLAVAAAATGHPAQPDLLLTLTARFGRMSWRYRSIAYANTLRTTGAIYQTLYLVATDLDLAPCGLGNGDADLSARVLGLDYLQESSVGEFILGRRHPQDVVTSGPLPTGWTLLDEDAPW